MIAQRELLGFGRTAAFRRRVLPVSDTAEPFDRRRPERGGVEPSFARVYPVDGFPGALWTRFPGNHCRDEGG